jgi:preprotein translocase subunit SecE
MGSFEMAKPKEAVDQLKPRRVGPITFLRETFHELKRVRWPGRKEVVNYTTAALLVCFVMGLLVWGFDVGVDKLLSLVKIV